MVRRTIFLAALIFVGCEDKEGAMDIGAVDAGASVDTGPAPQDSGVDLGVDQGTPDMGVQDMGGPMDTGPADMGADLGGMDAGDPCGPIARAELSGMMVGTLGRFIDRCTAELDAVESEAVSGFANERLAARLADTALVYDAAAAGQCLCDLESLACSPQDPFRALTSCAAVVTGTIAEGNGCINERCQPGLSCWRDWAFAPSACPGVCVAIGQLDDACESPFGDPYPCAPGLYCDTGKKLPACAPLRQPGEPCDFSNGCAGEVDAFLFPTTSCVSSKRAPICMSLGRMGDDCSNVPCHNLYLCDVNQTCQLKPRVNEVCTVPFADPTLSFEHRSNIRESARACLLNPSNASPSTICVQTSTNSGAGVCTPTPVATEACGIGPGRSARCDGTICSAIDPSDLMPASGVCQPRLALGETCDSGWDDFNFGVQCDSVQCEFGDPSVCSNSADGLCIND